MRGRKLRTWLVVVLTATMAGCQFADELLWPDSPPEGIETRGAAAASEPAPVENPAADPAAGQTALAPLMVIRSDSPDVDFETPLVSTVEQVLKLRPEARFDLVTVRPGRGTPEERSRAETLTRQQAERILQYLSSDLGLEPERLSLSATTNLSSNIGEVRIYLR